MYGDRAVEHDPKAKYTNRVSPPEKPTFQAVGLVTTSTTSLPSSSLPHDRLGGISLLALQARAAIFQLVQRRASGLLAQRRGPHGILGRGIEHQRRGASIAHLVERGVVQVGEGVARLVVAAVERLAGHTAEDDRLLRRLDAFGTGEQAPGRCAKGVGAVASPFDAK